MFRVSPYRKLVLAGFIACGAFLTSGKGTMAQTIANDPFSEQGSESFIGKHLLIGITFIDSDHVTIEEFQTHGKIIRTDQRGIIVEQANGAGSYSVPPDLTQLYPATPGDYTLRSTDELVTNPDFTSTWTISLNSGDWQEQQRQIALFKQAGYAAP